MKNRLMKMRQIVQSRKKQRIVLANTSKNINTFVYRTRFTRQFNR